MTGLTNLVLIPVWIVTGGWTACYGLCLFMLIAGPESVPVDVGDSLILAGGEAGFLAGVVHSGWRMFRGRI